MIAKRNDIIRRQFTISQAYYNCQNEHRIEGKLRWIKQSAIDLAKKLGWTAWEIEETYGHNSRWIDIATPHIGPKSWKEGMAMYGHCVYQVVLYKK